MSQMTIDKVKEARRLRETYGIGLVEAKQILQRREMITRIHEAQTLGDLKLILLDLVRHTFPHDPEA